MSSRYFRLHLHGLPRQLEDLVTERALILGSSGTAENLPFVQESKYLEVETLFLDQMNLDIFFESKPDGTFLRWVRELHPGLSVELKEEVHRDWLEEWKKGFDSFELVPGLWVVPSWLTPPQSAECFLNLDPGLAFGTGTHETTQMAAELMIALPLEAFDRVLDVGAGTGILSLVAGYKGASFVKAIEIDQMAREVARENLKRNPLYSQPIEVVDHLVEEEEGLFSLITANIIDGILVRLRSSFVRLLQPGGILVLSGVLRERSDEFLKEFLGSGQKFKVIQSVEKGLWCSYLLERLQ